MSLWGFLSASVLLTLTPGPDILFVLTQSITRGRKAGIIFAAGLCTGLVVHTVAVSLGLSLMLSKSPVAFMVLKVLGAAYLVYLGIKAFLGRHKAAIDLSGEAPVESQLYRKGILMNLLNPKVLLFFVAFFPQFVTPDAASPARELLLLGGIFMLQGMVVFSTVAVLADKLAYRLMRFPRFSYLMHIVEALIYIGIGVGLLFVTL